MKILLSKIFISCSNYSSNSCFNSICFPSYVNDHAFFKWNFFLFLFFWFHSEKKTGKSKLTINEFLDQVRGKPPSMPKKCHQRLNTSSDADYEFFNSDDDDTSDDDEDEEMKENMRRLVEKEKDDDCLFDSGYSEEGTLKTKSATKLDHSYSKSLQSLCRPQSKRESKGVAALLSLANAASMELKNLSRDSGTSSPEKETKQYNLHTGIPVEAN